MSVEKESSVVDCAISLSLFPACIAKGHGVFGSFHGFSSFYQNLQHHAVERWDILVVAAVPMCLRSH